MPTFRGARGLPDVRRAKGAVPLHGFGEPRRAQGSSLQVAMDLSGIKSYTGVINAALKEFVCRKRLERLAASLGKVDLALDDHTLEELREALLRDAVVLAPPVKAELTIGARDERQLAELEAMLEVST
ncbi:MAG: hypothetical protein H5T92_03995, partial [Synergistales bacterium]|nr:hypothetical protein [Synergistales bacterium]